MFFYDGLSCPHCGLAFEETDDIVACPVCGAPHHRDCWTNGGGCSCAATHGTDDQWSREKATAARAATPTFDPVTQPYSPPQTPAQPPLTPPPSDIPPRGAYNEYAPFHMPSPFGGVDPDKEIEGASVRDLAAVVRNNTSYYIPRFDKMHASGNNVSWNWAAFLIPTYWLLHRKQYLAGGVMFIMETLFTISSTLLSTWYLDPLLEATTTTTSSQNYDAFYAMLGSSPMYMIALGLAMLLGSVWIMFRVYFGLFGTKIYLSHCLRCIEKAKEAYPEGYHAQLSMMGGSTVILGIIAYLSVTFLSNLVYYFII